MFSGTFACQKYESHGLSHGALMGSSESQRQHARRLKREVDNHTKLLMGNGVPDGIRTRVTAVKEAT